jgi:signal transduction histidine kinase
MRTVVASVITMALVVSLTLFFLWRWAGQRMEGIISNQFNEQQLMLARKIADNVEFYFDFLEYQLTSYSQSYQVDAAASNHFRSYLSLQLKFLHNFGILGIRKFDQNGQLEYFYSIPSQVAPQEIRELSKDSLDWTRDRSNQGKILLTPTFLWPAPPWQDRKVMAILTPLYRSEERSLNDDKILRFAGVIEIIFDPYYICQVATQDVRSGKSGYAWIVDRDGTFLAHYEPAFIGKHHIKVRLDRNPALSFARIDSIMENKIARGEEGTDWYLSGWHREKLGQMKKLLAFTPIRFNRGLIQGITRVVKSDDYLWGVGVAAPFDEVYGLVQSFQIQEGLLVGFFFLLIIGISGLLIGAATNWNKTLKQEVDAKTEALRQSHDRLVRSERFAAVGEAAAYVSHEIKNPLMVIGGFARQLIRNADIPDPAQEKLKIISNEVKRLETFLGDLRDFTRPAPPNLKEANLNDIIRDVHNMMEETAGEIGVRLETDLDQGLPLAMLDPNQIKQVLINLVKNALEAMDGEGKIMVATSLREGCIALSVTDNGKGIQPEIMREIFNPFFTTKKTGTGLGLAVINKIIEDHHGTITVESPKGHGTTFTVILPAKKQ